MFTWSADKYCIHEVHRGYRARELHLHLDLSVVEAIHLEVDPGNPLLLLVFKEM